MSIVQPPTQQEAQALVVFVETIFPGKAFDPIARSSWALTFMQSGIPTKDLRVAIQSMLATEEYRPTPARIIKCALAKETAITDAKVDTVLAFVERHGIDRCGLEMEAAGNQEARALWRAIGGASWHNRNSTPDALRARLKKAAS